MSVELDLEASRMQRPTSAKGPRPVSAASTRPGSRPWSAKTGSTRAESVCGELPHLDIDNDCEVGIINRDYGRGSRFNARFNEVLPNSLMSGVFEFVGSDGGIMRFEGTFVNGFEFPIPHGVGIRYNADGSEYRGQWKGGRPHGQGEWMEPRLGESYYGEWRDGLRHGFGVAKFHNGDSYEGDFINGKFDGRGNYFYATGDSYQGMWSNGSKVSGTFFFRDGRESRRTYKDGRLMTTQDYDPIRRVYQPTITRAEVHNPDNTRYKSSLSGGVDSSLRPSTAPSGGRPQPVKPSRVIGHM